MAKAIREIRIKPVVPGESALIAAERLRSVEIV